MHRVVKNCLCIGADSAFVVSLPDYIAEAFNGVDIQKFGLDAQRYYLRPAIDGYGVWYIGSYDEGVAFAEGDVDVVVIEIRAATCDMRDNVMPRVRVQPEVLVNVFGNHNFYVPVVGKEVLHN